MARNSSAEQEVKETKEVKTIRKQGGSLSIRLTQQFQEMGLTSGDQVFIVKTPNGIELSKYDPHFAKTMSAAREAMARFPNALKELAK